MTDITRRTAENHEKIESFLVSQQLNPAEIKNRTPDAAVRYLCDMLMYSREPQDSIKPLDTLNPLDPRLQQGLLLVKPEMAPYGDRFCDFLEERGMSIAQTSSLIYPSHEQWLAQYGYLLDDYPIVIHSYITQRALGVTAIVFNHNLSCYDLPGVSGDGLDIDYLFDQRYCGQSDSTHPDTLRGEVSYHALRSLGFGAMTGYAEPFNVCGFFGENTNSHRTYNGVHIPANQSEKYRNLQTYGGMLL